MNLWKMLKVSKGLPSADYSAMLFRRKTGKNSVQDVTVSGVPCVLEKSKGKPVIDYKIYGNTVQDGTPTPENPVEVQSVGEPVYAEIQDKNGFALVDADGFALHSNDIVGYEIPVVCRSENREPVRTSIFLDEPLHKVGDYADFIDFENGRIVRNVQKIIFDGTENWKPWSANFSETERFFITLNNAVKNASLSKAFCNYFVYNAQNSDGEGFRFSGNGNIYNQIVIQISREKANDIEQLKAWIAEKFADSTPLTFWYLLAEPTEENVILPEIPTFDGTTVVEIDTEIPPSDMEITYKSRR